MDRLDADTSLNPGEIHIWVFDLVDQGPDHSKWRDLLSTQEIARSESYRFKQDRDRFIARRGLLRQLLGEYSRLEPSEIVYQTSPFGKLSIPSQKIRFNLSKCRERVVFAFALEKEIGIDLEQVYPMEEMEAMQKTWFSLSEQQDLNTLDPLYRTEGFFHVWTQKEAFLKAHGEGLSLPLQDFSVSTHPNLPGKILWIKDQTEAVSHWKMITPALGVGWRLAVCIRSITDLKVSIKTGVV